MRTAIRKSFLLALLIASIPQILNGRYVQPWSYEEMLEKADVVVVAEWVSTKDTEERAILPNIEPAIQVIGVDTEFEVTLVLKGARALKNLTLHHYKLEFEEDTRRAEVPQLVSIQGPDFREGIHYPGGGRFLLFLKHEPDGRYAPITGQTDPAAFSVLQLGVAIQ
jgi:hypothetical protein